jgi:hypothetical protein
MVPNEFGTRVVNNGILMILYSRATVHKLRPQDIVQYAEKYSHRLLHTFALRVRTHDSGKPHIDNVQCSYFNCSRGLQFVMHKIT